MKYHLFGYSIIWNITVKMEGLPIRQRYTLRSQQGATDSENSDENKENS